MTGCQKFRTFFFGTPKNQNCDGPPGPAPPIKTHMYIYIYTQKVDMYSYIQTHAHIHTHMPVYIYIQTEVCMYYVYEALVREVHVILGMCRTSRRTSSGSDLCSGVGWIGCMLCVDFRLF